MQKIPLTQGMVALVDDEDFEYLHKYKWCLSYGFKTDYAKRGMFKDGKHITLRMHRIILNAPLGIEVDHINGNGLDNRRCNLRLCTTKQNRQNRKLLAHNTSGFIGVSYRKDNKKWQASIYMNNKQKHLGFFSIKENAAFAYNKVAHEIRGEFAQLNEVPPSP